MTRRTRAAAADHECERGWLGEDEKGRPIPCPICKPNPGPPVPLDRNTKAAPEQPARMLVPTFGSQVRMQRVKWLMDSWVVLGGLNLLAGREGLGKSTLAVDIAAKVTKGTLAGELAGTPRHVIYLCTEDDPAFTVVPRLKAADADLAKVIFLKVQDQNTTEGNVVLPRDLEELERIVSAFDVALIVLDAATSVMAAQLDGHDDRKVRQFLEPLAQSAAKLSYSALAVCHFGKRDGADTGKLVLGSIAWSQVARSVLAVAQDPDSEDLVITNTKTNLAATTRSMSARIVSATVGTDDGPTSVGRVEWTGSTDRDARQILGADPDEADEPGGNPARAFILAYLHRDDVGGEASAGDIIKAGRAAGFNDTELKDARRRSRGPRIKSRKASMGGGWVWAVDIEIPEGGTEGGEGGVHTSAATFATFVPPSESGSPSNGDGAGGQVLPFPGGGPISDGQGPA